MKKTFRKSRKSRKSRKMKGGDDKTRLIDTIKGLKSMIQQGDIKKEIALLKGLRKHWNDHTRNYDISLWCMIADVYIKHHRLSFIKKYIPENIMVLIQKEKICSPLSKALEEERLLNEELEQLERLEKDTTNEEFLALEKELEAEGLL